MSSNPKRFGWSGWGSLRSRLALWYGAILGSVFLFLGLLLFFYLSETLRTGFDLSLRATAETLARSSLEQRPSRLEENIDRLLKGIDDPDFFSKFFQFLDLAGRPGFQSRNIPKQSFPLTREALDNAERGDATFETFSLADQSSLRVLTYPVVLNGVVVNLLQVGGSLRNIEKILGEVKFILGLTLPAILILAVVGGWILSHRALRPVETMAQVADRIAEGDLSQRISIPQKRDELAGLAETFNRMISRIEESVSRIRQFSTDASHELRTPLTILKGEAELALRHPGTIEDFQQTLVSILEEINRISRIVEDLFILSKSDIGEVRLEMKALRLDRLIEETVSQIELLATGKQVSLTVDPTEASTILGDPDRLRALLLNLIENAVRYTPPGGRIALALRQEKSEAILTISDTGIGIPEADLPKVFDRFHRSDNARAMNPKGSGLGLSICQWIVMSQGGEISVTSVVGQGTTFCVRLPLQTPDQGDFEKGLPIQAALK